MTENRVYVMSEAEMLQACGFTLTAEPKRRDQKCPTAAALAGKMRLPPPVRVSDESIVRRP